MSAGSAGDGTTYTPFPSIDEWDFTFDSESVDRYATLLAEVRERVSPDAMTGAVRIATRYAAVDTGAIEGLYQVSRGFTKTIATQVAGWEAALREHGEHVERAITDALNAYEFVLDAATGERLVTESWTRQLHETICGSQETYKVHTAVGVQLQPLPKGVYKTAPNNPTSLDTGRVHHYAPVADAPSEMARLVSELRSETFRASHPVVQAAYSHYIFAGINPFADGNGRVARALASVFLYRSPGVPLVVFADQKDTYLDALEAADKGRPDAFVHFVEQRTIDTIEIVRTYADVAGTMPAEDSLAALREILRGEGDLSHVEVDASSVRLTRLVREMLTERFAALDLPDGYSTDVVAGYDGEQPPAGFRRVADSSEGNEVRLRAGPPAAVTVQDTVAVWPARQGDQVPALRVKARRLDRHLDILVRDLHPVETEALRLKVDAWLEDLTNVYLAELTAAVSANLARQGYRRG